MTDQDQPTLFNLHECMADASFDEPYRLKIPIIGEPARKARDLNWVEQALFDATDDDRLERDKALAADSMTASFICDRLTMLKLHSICRANGTRASAFLRQCARRLVTEYEQPGG